MNENMEQPKKEKKEKIASLIEKLLWIPLMIVLGIVPLIVHSQTIYYEEHLGYALDKAFVIDFFSSYKSVLFMIMAIISGIALFFLIDKEKVKLDKYIKLILMGALVFIGVTLLATLTSEYKETAWSGMGEQFQGFWTYLGYIIMMIYAIYCFMKYENYMFIVIPLAVVIIINTLLGGFQFMGYDLFRNHPFFQKLIMSKEEYETFSEVTGLYDEGNIYGTMSHYDYVGSFAAMMVPFFISLTLFIKGKVKKVVFAVLSLCSLFLLFASTSRAGLVGVGIAAVLAVILLGKKAIQKWKLTLSVVMLALVGILGVNIVTSGEIFNRLPSLVGDVMTLISPVQEDFDYTQYIPVKSIEYANKETTLAFQTGKLTMSYEKESVSFKDEEGNKVDAVLMASMQEGTTGTFYAFQDPRFAHITFKIAEVTAVEGEVPPTVLTMGVNGQDTLSFLVNGNEGVVLCDSYPIQAISYQPAESIGFKGKEKLGSARGYIWSRSLPLLKSTWLVGNGPDTFAAYFPQDDFLAKWWAYGEPDMIVDKPHNLYLQIAIDAGGLALIGFLVIILTYLWQSMKLYGFRGYYSMGEYIGIALTLTITAYLGAGFFNDSVISVAPVFWTLLGCGIGVNYLVAQERKRIALVK